MPATLGTELMRKINDGRLQKAPSSEILRFRTEICGELEELLETGARVRPLMVGKDRVGWVRGVHMSERKYLARYYTDPVELAEHIVRLGTTLPDDYVRDFTTVELMSLLRLITEMTNSDLRLFPFVSPFSTTSLSEQLWLSKGMALNDRRSVELPDGQRLALAATPDHTRLWSWFCSHRETNKQRNDETANACLILRGWVGKSADSLANEIRQVGKALLLDRVEPWVEAIKYDKPVNLDDGWAHGEDSSPEGMMREIKGMLSNDRHERVMAEFERSQRIRAEVAQATAEDRIAQQGGAGVFERGREVLTAEEAKRRAVELKKNRNRQRQVVEDLGQNPGAKLLRYQ